MLPITIKLDTRSGAPLYEQIIQQVRQQVLQGFLKDGDQLPSIRVLARDLQVSIITTKRAYEELEREGLLTVSTGRGTFVRTQGMEHSRQQQTEELRTELFQSSAKARLLGLNEDEFSTLARQCYKQEEST